MYKFIELLKCENSDVVKNLVMFVFKAFEIRNGLMYQNSYHSYLGIIFLPLVIFSFKTTNTRVHLS